MDETKLVSSFWEDNGTKVKFTWHPGEDIKKYEPYNQVYGVVFNDKGEILIQRREQRAWCLAGGTVENTETAEETLKRELIEEADVTVKNIILLGGQRVQYIEGHNPNPDKKRGGDDFYQLRYYCELDELLPQTPDPDHGTINERRFVPANEVNNYLNWGDTGAAIFNQAIQLYRKNKN